MTTKLNKTVRVNVRTTPKDIRTITQRAQKAGVSRNKYLLTCALETTQKIEPYFPLGLTMYITPEQKREIKKRAKAAGMLMSAYVRYCALNDPEDSK